MVFKNIAEKAQEQAGNLATAAQEKIDALIDEYNKILPLMEELGLSVNGFSIEAGVLPEIRTSLVGSIDNIKEEAINKIIAKNEGNKLLEIVLKAVLMAKKCHEKLEGVYISILKDIIVDIKLGVPPAVSVRFQ